MALSAFLLATAVVSTSCSAFNRTDAAGEGSLSPRKTVDPRTETPSPTRPAIPATPPATSGPESEKCVHGWYTPAKGSELYTFPLGAIRKAVTMDGDPVIVDMRYFAGPESPPSVSQYMLSVERWYLKLYLPDDLSFQGRFLVERRRWGTGVSAVAPYDTKGFKKGDWTGFQWTTWDRDPKAYEGLPGRWRGAPFDFVTGSSSNPDLKTVQGLPRDVIGCMTGT